jgi:predicted dehydrogenase
MRKLRVGVIGAGLIAQVMHLHYLRELADRFEVVGIADIVPANAEAVARRHDIPNAYGDWHVLLDQPLDVVLVLTGGSHAPMAVAAAKRGIHVLVEKPMSYTVTEGVAMVETARANGVVLMVGYQKRYDPAYVRFREEVAAIADERLMRVTTLESPYWPYVQHYDTIRPQQPAPQILESLRAESDALVTEAIGDASALHRQIYENVLLASLVHELNAVRGLLGEPDLIEHASLRAGSVTVLFRFGGVPVTLDRIDLPGIARYSMEFALYGPQRRATLAFPSPFLRSEPTLIRVDDGVTGTTASRSVEEITSYESAF